MLMPGMSEYSVNAVKELYDDGLPNSVITRRTGIGFLEVCRIVDDIVQSRRDFKPPVAPVDLDKWHEKTRRHYQYRVSKSKIKHTGLAVKCLENRNGTLLVGIHEDVAPGRGYVERILKKSLKEFSKTAGYTGSFRVSYRRDSVYIRPVKKDIRSGALLGAYAQFLETEKVERI